MGYDHSLFIMNSGEPLSALDGVPIAVKDEIDCRPYPTTGKSSFIVLNQLNFICQTNNPLLTLSDL